MPTSINKLVEAFPQPTIPPIIGVPTYDTISEVIMILSSNAALILTNLGCGTLGYLALLETPDIYNTISATPFVPPPNPGAAPTVPPGTTSIEQTRIRYDFVAATSLYSQLHNVKGALLQQLLGSVDNIYLWSLQTRHIGYGNTTVRQFLDHLISTYPNISAADFQDNDARFRKPYNPNLLFGTVLDQV